MSNLTDLLLEDTYGRWAAGNCPCCGGPFDCSDAKPLTIGEGVQMCGDCVENDHHGIIDYYTGRTLSDLILECILEGARKARQDK